MATPTTAIQRFDLSLTYNEFSLEAQRRKYIGLRVFAPIAVAQEQADFARIDIAATLTKIEDTERKPRATYARDYYRWIQDSYHVKEHGVEETVDDAEIELYGDIIRVEELSASRAINRLLMPLEDEIAVAAQDSVAIPTAAAGVAWDVKATADPIADIDVARDAVEAATGESEGITLIIPKPAFVNMIRTDRIESLLKFDAFDVLVATNDGMNLNAMPQVSNGLRQLFQVDQILIARAFKNTAPENESRAVTLTRFWDPDKVTLALTSTDGMTGDLSSVRPALGRTVFTNKNSEPIPGDMTDGSGSMIMEEYREEARRGGVLRPRNKYQVKTLDTKAAFVITGVQT